MLSRLFLFFRKLDIYLLGLSVLLGAVGLLMIYSVTRADTALSSLSIRQLIFFLSGLIVLFIFAAINYRHLYRVGGYAYLLSAFLLAGVLLFGLSVKGSLRWFDLGFFRLQPVEFSKLALIIFLAAFFQKNLNQLSRFRTVLVSAGIAAVPVALTLLQPDMGSALVLVAIWAGMLASTNVKKKYLVWLLLGLAVLGLLAWAFFLADYQKDRILSFFNPAADPQGRGYNALQAMVATGSGGITGRGFARGIVSGLRFLPERQTDFIFASLAEELGFVGAGFLLLALFGWFWRMIKVIYGSSDNFSCFLSVGIFFYLFTQTVINIGMNIGVLPITGIPLPLVSYGGSSMIASMVAIGILQSVSKHSYAIEKRD